MNKRKIYISDLTYTFQGRVSEFVPYGIGCIKSYFLEYSDNRNEFDVVLFKYPQAFIDNFLKHKPEVVAFSNYVWNSNLSYSLVKEVKRISPKTLVIFGGPNYPLENELREKWLQDRKEIDIYIIGEGEIPFMKVVDLWHETGNIEHIRRSGIEGCHSLVEGKLYNSDSAVPRLKSLDDFPSPYTKGYLDEFLEETGTIPMVPTTRGCPFSCTFCVKGFNIWTRVVQKSTDKFREEIEYIAEKATVKLLGLGDDNFGIFPQDIEISKILARAKEDLNYPY